MPRKIVIKRRRKDGTKFLSKPAAKAVRAIAKKSVLRMAETKVATKQTPGSPTIPTISQLFHNQPFYAGNFLSTTQGIQDPNTGGNNSRIGDEIILKSINFRFLLSCFRPNVTYKLVLFWYETQAALANALVYFTQGCKLLDRYNTEQISIIDQKMVYPGSINRQGGDNNPPVLPTDAQFQRRTQLVNLNGYWKHKKIKYDEGTTVPKWKNIGICVVAYDSVNTLQTDALGELVYDYKLFFKDL